MEAFCHAAPVGGGLSTTGQEGNGSAQGGELLTERDLAREPVLEPAKRWRNWYLSRSIWDDGDTNPVAIDPTAYPSRDVAETVAYKQLARMPEYKRPFYLGAFPVSE